MSGKILFACSKCFSRHPFEELSSGQQLCKSCRGSTSVGKCTFCRSEFLPSTKSQSACKKCEYGKGKYGKPQACEWCKIVAAFGSTKCMRCNSYEAKYGPPVHCDECKLRSAFDRRDENKKVNGKLLCWLCTCAYKRALMKAQQDGRISSSKKRPHEKSSTHRDNSASKKPSRPEVSKSGSGGVSAVSGAGLDLPEKNSRSGNNGGNGTIVAPAVISIDPNSTDHVVAITNLKERIASLEKRLQMKDKELLEKDKQLTELKGRNFERENDMRNKLKEMERLNDMKVENLNRKITSLLKEIAGLKKANKKTGSSSSNNINRIDKGLLKVLPENISPKEEIVDEREKSEKEDIEKDEKSRDGERDEKESVRSGSSSPSSN